MTKLLSGITRTRQQSQQTKENQVNELIELIDLINESGNFDSDDFYELGQD